MDGKYLQFEKIDPKTTSITKVTVRISIYKSIDFYINLPEYFKNNKRVVIAAVREIKNVLEYIPEIFKNDKDVIISLVGSYPNF